MEGKDKIVEDKQKYWDSCAKLYDQRIQMVTYQQYVTLLTHTEAAKSMRILELAIGSGTHSLYFAKTLMQRGATIVCTEISQKMLEMAQQKFEDQENEFSCFSHNKIHFIQDETCLDGTNKQSIDDFRNGFDQRDRLVLGCIANNECLPFPDGHFDCYIAPLSL